jgi:Pentapeptide repeats (8 copies)
VAWEITTTELLERYAVGERNFAGIELIPPPGVSNAPRDGIDLEWARLDNAIIRDANLRGTNLSRCCLDGADLTGTELVRVNATNATFRRAYIECISGSILAYANFQDAHTSKRGICRAFNLIWETTLPDGTVERDAYWQLKDYTE